MIGDNSGYSSIKFPRKTGLVVFFAFMYACQPKPYKIPLDSYAFEIYLHIPEQRRGWKITIMINQL